jgi:phosphate transport system permease protein
MQIYDWMSRAQTDFKQLAAAGILVLMTILVAMNSVAIVLRERASRKARW